MEREARALAAASGRLHHLRALRACGGPTLVTHRKLEQVRIGSHALALPNRPGGHARDAVLTALTRSPAWTHVDQAPYVSLSCTVRVEILRLRYNHTHGQNS
jgi:hypothetical protein